MIQILRLNSGYFAKEISKNDSSFTDDIFSYMEDGIPVILVKHINDVEDLNIDPKEVILLGKERLNHINKNKN